MSVKVLITGDFCPTGRSGIDIENEDYSVFGEMIKHSQQADLSITNLESPLTQSSTPIRKTGPNIKSCPKAIKSLAYAKFNLVTLANNHIMDYGEVALKDTIYSCIAENINYVGAGSNLTEARKPFYIDINGVRIGVLNFAENEFCAATNNNCGANPVSSVKNHYDIREAKSKSDYLFVIVHGGREHYQLPTPKQRERYRFYLESGADVVVGHHPHCFSGYESYKEKHIFYSLGNFIFDYKKKYRKGLWTQGYGVLFNIEHSQLSFELLPYNQGKENDHRLKFLNAEERNIFDDEIDKLNTIIIDDNLFNNEWKKYLKSQNSNYKGMLLLQNKYIRAAVAKGLLPPCFFHSQSHKLLLLNLLRCESHREIMINVLEDGF